MKFSSIFRNSFIEGFSVADIGTNQIVLTIVFTTVISLYIFFCYRYITRKTFYSKSFNISLVALALITAGIILTIQSSIIISLGMVGALSIVRFRTAVKEPMDLVFLFWSISAGIICGAGLMEIALLFSLAVSLLILLLDKIPLLKMPRILVINAGHTNETELDIKNAIDKSCKYFNEKSRVISDGKLELVYEVRTDDEKTLTDELTACKGVTYVSLLSHDGEVNF